MALPERTSEEEALRRLRELAAEARTEAEIAAARADAFAVAVDVMSRRPF